MRMHQPANRGLLISLVLLLSSCGGGQMTPVSDSTLGGFWTGTLTVNGVAYTAYAMSTETGELALLETDTASGFSAQYWGTISASSDQLSASVTGAVLDQAFPFSDGAFRGTGTASDFVLSGSTTFNVVNGNPPPQPGGTPAPAYINVWVTGQFNTSGSSQVVQANNVYVTWIVDKDITVSGSSYNNQSGRAANTSFIGVGTDNKITASGGSNFVGTINAPGYDVTVSGTGSLVGALIGNTINISGGASYHYDEHLNTNDANSAVGNYAFASWFEDTR